MMNGIYIVLFKSTNASKHTQTHAAFINSHIFIHWWQNWPLKFPGNSYSTSCSKRSTIFQCVDLHTYNNKRALSLGFNFPEEVHKLPTDWGRMHHCVHQWVANFCACVVWCWAGCEELIRALLPIVNRKLQTKLRGSAGGWWLSESHYT